MGEHIFVGQRARSRLSWAVAFGAVVLIAASCSDSDNAAPSTSAVTANRAATTATPAAASPTSVAASASTTAASASAPLYPAPIQPVPPLLDQAKVDNAVAQIDGLVQSAMDLTGVPGIAVAVVYKDKVIFAKGYGVREVGKPDKVDPDTVFQVASVSKPLASTIVAGVVGQKAATWTEPVVTYNPGFKLKDPYVTAHATLADLLSHRSGLYTGAGDLLEDLGWDRDYILSKLDQQPLDDFRSTYNYSNFGITEAGEAAADVMKTTWEDLADKTLITPLGMTSTSYRHTDYESRTNKALIHVEVGDPKDKKWEAKYVRDADAEAPAGGASSSVKDLTQFIRLQLGHGSVDGKAIIDSAALQVTHVPHQELGQPTTPGVRTQFYGLGWNVITDDEGRIKLDHSGAFATGAATNVALIEGESLGIVTLTNGSPLGLPEGINNAFFDAAQHGKPTVDWIKYYEGAFRGLLAQLDKQGSQYATPPASPAPAKPDSAYVGTYNNSYYGPLTVASNGGALSMMMGPPTAPTTFALTHFDGDVYTFQTIGENAAGLSNATFDVGSGGTASTVTLGFYNTIQETGDPNGLGTFTRA